MNLLARIDPYTGSGFSCLRLAVMRPMAMELSAVSCQHSARYVDLNRLTAESLTAERFY